MIKTELFTLPGNDWDDVILNEVKQTYFNQLMNFVNEQYEHATVYPKKEEIFAAFQFANVCDVKVVILGQDPYHNENQAHGLCFSVGKDCKIPPSLKNIYQELYTDLGIEAASHGNLISWAKQGVLLINTVFTVREHEPNSHKDKGWEIFSDHIISYLDQLEQPMVFVLWGTPSGKKKKLLKNKAHLILESTHPSPLSSYRGFFGSKPFSKINQYLKEHNVAEIDWKII